MTRERAMLTSRCRWIPLVDVVGSDGGSSSYLAGSAWAWWRLRGCEHGCEHESTSFKWNSLGDIQCDGLLLESIRKNIESLNIADACTGFVEGVTLEAQIIAQSDCKAGREYRRSLGGLWSVLQNRYV